MSTYIRLQSLMPNAGSQHLMEEVCCLCQNQNHVVLAMVQIRISLVLI